MIDWDQWQTLLAVFRNGTHAGAATALGIDATTVGRRLKLLQRHLGYELFLRENGRLYPTRRCEGLLAHLESASEALRGAEQEMAAMETGSIWREVRVTAPPFLVTGLLAPRLHELVRDHRLRVELRGTASKAILSRRETDIAVRIEDRPQSPDPEEERIDAERIGALDYAVYHARGADPEALPWAGLMEEHARTTGTETMHALAGSHGFQFRAFHFETLREIAATGAARAMLPRVVGDADARLAPAGETVLSQPLWMLYHRGDRGVRYMDDTRAWITATAEACL